MKVPWIQKVLRVYRCHLCDAPLRNARIEAIGTVDPKYRALPGIGPCASLSVCCANCRYSQTFITQTTAGELLDAITQFHWDHHQQALHRDHCAEPDGSSSEPSQADQSDHSRRITPSIRAGTPPTPISEAEQQRFIKRLERISVKRSTKSFQQWLRRLMDG